MIHWCYLFRCWKFNDVWLNIGVFCASCARSCIVDGSPFSFADGAVVCSTSLMASLIMKHETPARCRTSRSVKQSSGLQKDYKFKFKYFIAPYTWQGVYRGSCNKVSHTHTHENLTKHNITKYEIRNPKSLLPLVQTSSTWRLHAIKTWRTTNRTNTNRTRQRACTQDNTRQCEKHWDKQRSITK